MSSIYNDFKPNPMGQMSEMITQFNKFKSMFTGNPEEQVKQLLQTGQMSQEQFNELAQMANQLRGLIK